MLRGRKTFLVLILTALVLIAGVLVVNMINADNDLRTVDLYFLNEGMTSIVPEKRDVKYDLDDEPADIIISELVKGSAEGNKRIMPKDTTWTVKRDSSRLLVDFSQNFLTTDNTQNLLSTYAVVKSLCSLQGVSAVKVTVVGGDIIAPDNSTLGYISDKDINLEKDRSTSDTKSIKLYFATKEGKLFYEWRNVTLRDTVAVGEGVVTEIIKGPKEEGLLPTVSSDTQIISVEITEKIAYVNMSQSFIDKNKQTPDKEKLAVYSIVNSLCELGGIEAVQFLIDGKKISGFESVDLTNLIFEDNSLF